MSLRSVIVSCLLQDAVRPRTSVFLSDVETDTWPPDTVMQLAAQSDRWLVTRGEFGAHEFTAEQGMSLVEPVKVNPHSKYHWLLHASYNGALQGLSEV